jgi:hypothetical protein
MVLDVTINETETIKQLKLDSLREYIASLEAVIENDREDIRNVRNMADNFISQGQFENYGYLMERIWETEQRIETCIMCIDECRSHIAYKEQLAD